MAMENVVKVIDRGDSEREDDGCGDGQDGRGGHRTESVISEGVA